MVTVRSTESVIVQVRPGAELAVARDTTEEARKAGDEHVVEQLKTIVTIDSRGSGRNHANARSGAVEHQARPALIRTRDNACRA